MIITVEQYPKEPKYRQKVVIEIKDDADIDEMTEAWRKMLLALGYHPDNVKDIFYKVDKE